MTTTVRRIDDRGPAFSIAVLIDRKFADEAELIKALSSHPLVADGRVAWRYQLEYFLGPDTQPGQESPLTGIRLDLQGDERSDLLIVKMNIEMGLVDYYHS